MESEFPGCTFAVPDVYVPAERAQRASVTDCDGASSHTRPTTTPSAWRNVVLTVEETDDANHTVSFMGEAPVMQYNFLLRGKGAFGRVNTYPCLSA